MAAAKEKRRQERVPVDLWVEVHRDVELYFQRALNLSLGGMFFTQTVPLPVGTRVALKFELPGDPQPLECGGTIVATKELGMGVQFAGLNAVDRGRIEKLMGAAR